MISKRSTAFSAAFVAAALSLSACSSSSDSTPNNPAPSSANSPAPSAEPALENTGKMVLYSGRDEKLVGPLIELFEQESGITVDVRYAGTTELAGQLLEEGSNSPADVFFSQDAGALGLLADQGLFTTLSSDVTDSVEAKYTSHDDSWVGVTGRARVIAYDSEKLSADEVPGDVFELLDPQWNGRFAIAPTNASFQAFVTALRADEGEERAKEWLEGIKANGVQIYGKNGEILEAVNNGAVELGLINHYYWARSEVDPTTLRAQLKFGDAGSTSALVNVTGAGILKTSENLYAAQEFVKFLVSDTAQQYFLDSTYEYPLVAGFASPAGVPALEELGGPDLDLAKLADLEATVELLAEVGLI